MEDAGQYVGEAGGRYKRDSLRPYWHGERGVLEIDVMSKCNPNVLWVFPQTHGHLLPKWSWNRSNHGISLPEILQWLLSAKTVKTAWKDFLASSPNASTPPGYAPVFTLSWQGLRPQIHLWIEKLKNPPPLPFVQVLWTPTILHIFIINWILP